MATEIAHLCSTATAGLGSASWLAAVAAVAAATTIAAIAAVVEQSLQHASDWTFALGSTARITRIAA